MRFFLFGIKGSGMASLAIILKEAKFDVIGYDIKDYLMTEKELNENDINYVTDLNDYDYQEKDIIIFSSAFKEDERLISFVQRGNFNLEYHEMVALFFNHSPLICVSGTHGKTTLVGLLESACKRMNILRGDGHGLYNKLHEGTIIEACEYQNHFKDYLPTTLFITSLSLDHTDYFKTEVSYFEAFKKLALKAETIIIENESQKKLNLKRGITYGIEGEGDYELRNYHPEGTYFTGDVYEFSSYLGSISLPFVGRHMAKLSLAVIAYLRLQGMDLLSLEKSLAKFPGVKRRNNIYQNGDITIVDDYAHQPEQIDEMIDGMREAFKKPLLLIFKPDRLSRLIDFKYQFKNSFDKADYCLVDEFSHHENLEAFDEIVSELSINTYSFSKLNNIMQENKKITILLLSSKSMVKIKDDLEKLGIKYGEGE